MRFHNRLLAPVCLVMAMTACVNEEVEFGVENAPLGDNDVAFSIGRITTRSSDASTAPRQSFNLGDSGFCLEETVTNLDEIPVATKGTPIYTENITNFYQTINVVGYDGSDVVVEDSPFELLQSDKTIYHKTFQNSFWPSDSDKQLYFFLRAPADYIDAQTSDMVYDSSDGTIAFDYTSKTKGDEQKDILFTSRALTKAQYYDGVDGVGPFKTDGAPVTFYHALTGVKFRVGNDNSGTTKTIITGVKITGLRSSGECVITPSGDGVSKDKVVWDRLDNSTTFSQEFANPEYSVDEDGSIDLAASDNTNFTGTSLVSADADQNLNDAEASLTFWFIPQEIDEYVTLEVPFRVKTPDTPAGTEIKHTINFGERLKNSGKNYSWEAGELRTYTLIPKDVDVEIFDVMNGLEKSGLHVTNTGNVDEYVRMMLIGNWYGWTDEATYNAWKSNPSSANEPKILVGYTEETGNTMVTPWYREDDDFKAGFDTETFENGRPSGDNKWIFGTGSYFYYPDPIGAGDKLSQTTALFQSYTLDEDWIPKIWIPSSEGGRVRAVGVHLVMECVIQAISTINPETGEEYVDDGDNKAWMQAWSQVTGRDIKPKG